VPNATTVNRFLVDRIRRGRATVADLAAGGATQRQRAWVLSGGLVAVQPAVAGSAGRDSDDR